MPKGAFATYHPVVSMLFFIAAICFAFCTRHPVYVVLSLAGAAAYLAFLKGPKRLGVMLLYFIPISLFIALLNSLFNSVGATELWRAGPFFISLEGCLFGLAAGGMLMAVLTWFSCYTEIMTEDKFTYLFGHVAPTLSLVVSMVSRWVPRMASRGRNIFDAQESLIGGFDMSKGGLVKRGLRLATVLTGLGMEDSIHTSDSMRARGYGTQKRTSYARYSWHTRERVALVALVALVAINVVGIYIPTSTFAYYPRVSPVELWWGYFPYVLFLAFPFILELEQIFSGRSASQADLASSPAVQRLLSAQRSGRKGVARPQEAA